MLTLALKTAWQMTSMEQGKRQDLETYPASPHSVSVGVTWSKKIDSGCEEEFELNKAF